MWWVGGKDAADQKHLTVVSADQPRRPIEQKCDGRWCAAIGGGSCEEEPLTVGRYDVMIALADKINYRRDEQRHRG